MKTILRKPLHLLISIPLLSLCFALTCSANSWNLEHDDDGIKVYTQEIEGSSFKAFRGETSIKSSLHNLMAHHTDISAMELWLQDCAKSEVLRRISNKDFYIYQRTSAPWPVSDRDYVLHANIKQDPKTYAVTMTFEASTAVKQNHEDCVPVTQLTGYWRFTPQGDGYIFVEYETHADPSGDLPAWLANSFVVDQPLGTLEKMRRRVESNSYQLPKEMSYIIEPPLPLAIKNKSISEQATKHKQ
ncbi:MULTISPECIES: START domain-containing protein [unclassified Oleiphilus]|uniref:START domain-containing protein n=1 Tax=unclassified Oleiphilus TaxID=2631174 RepID=UPI0007C3D96F|nr:MULTISPECIES: START domain-containing protein [unclassified Oleiphilus]KZY44300.1 hypothetical protein A3732_12625 [Oleiphilus sp. HI0050]KZZ33105.1 hypothetical protein A3756_04780 [Oleiphilus sp. HI0086]KZZ38325.1 hypothetical protein A3757_01255 [Oleiphilus sp. HI0117]KZZ56968.1 hypothetical protein A3761_07310 [Oleiphilus sp. HI0123]